MLDFRKGKVTPHIGIRKPNPYENMSQCSECAKYQTYAKDRKELGE